MTVNYTEESYEKSIIELFKILTLCIFSAKIISNIKLAENFYKELI